MRLTRSNPVFRSLNRPLTILGAERKLFFFALMMGAGVFNLLADWKARRLTDYTEDDGQELTYLSFSSDGKTIVYVRGGDHGANWDDDAPVNVAASPIPPKVQILSAPFDGGEPKVIGDGDDPAISPRGDVVAFVKNGQIWAVPIDGSAPAKAIVTDRGNSGQLEWSPNGSRLAFVANRGDHAFVGVYTNDSTPLRWLAPPGRPDTIHKESPRDPRPIA